MELPVSRRYGSERSTKLEMLDATISARTALLRGSTSQGEVCDPVSPIKCSLAPLARAVGCSRPSRDLRSTLSVGHGKRRRPPQPKCPARGRGAGGARWVAVQVAHGLPGFASSSFMALVRQPASGASFNVGCQKACGFTREASGRLGSRPLSWRRL